MPGHTEFLQRQLKTVTVRRKGREQRTNKMYEDVRSSYHFSQGRDDLS